MQYLPPRMSFRRNRKCRSDGGNCAVFVLLHPVQGSGRFHRRLQTVHQWGRQAGAQPRFGAGAEAPGGVGWEDPQAHYHRCGCGYQLPLYPPRAPYRVRKAGWRGCGHHRHRGTAELQRRAGQAGHQYIHWGRGRHCLPWRQACGYGSDRGIRLQDDLRRRRKPLDCKGRRICHGPHHLRVGQRRGSGAVGG